MGIADKILEKAKVSLILSEPFFGTLLLKLKYLEDYTQPTAWTDGTRLGYNPKYIASLEFDLVKSLLAHEVMHCVCAHQSRRNGRKPKKWNYAADYVVNDILKEAGFKISEDWLISSTYKNMSTEQVFSALPDPPPSGGKGKGGKEGGKGGGSPGEGDDYPQMPGEVRDAPAKEGSQQSASEAAAQSEIGWIVAGQQAAKIAKACGKLPGALGHLIESLTAPQISWREELRDFITEKVANDYSWQMPNKRYIHTGIYLPSISDRYEPAKAMCYVDASGSVGEKELEVFAAEMTGILEEFPNIELTCRYFDTSVKDDTLIFGGDDLPLKLDLKHIGGGTDFRPIVEDVLNFEEPKFLVVFTDLCGNFPDIPPSYPVLWVSTFKHAAAPFGRTVYVEV